MKIRIQLLLLSVAVCTVSSAQKNFSFQADKGTMKVRNFDFEEVKSKTGSTARVRMEYDFDSMEVGSNRFFAMTPVLVSKDKQYMKAFRPTVVSGERQFIMFQRDGRVLPEYDGCDIIRLKTMKDKDPLPYLSETGYEPWMSGAYLYFANDLCGCCELKDSALVGPFLRTAIDPLELVDYCVTDRVDSVKTFKLKGSAYINFVVDTWNLDVAYMDNSRELRKITDTLNIMTADPYVTVDTIKIHGYASPESPYVHNEMLATNRARTITDYVRMLYPMIPDYAFAPAEATPENWGDLRDSVDVSELRHRNEILAIIDEALRVPEGQKSRCDALEGRIKSRYPEEYRRLKNYVYPHLRRTDYEVSFTVCQFSDAEAEEAIKNRPGYLSVEELANLTKIYTKESEEYRHVFEVAHENFGDDARSCLVMANAALQKGDTDTAAGLLEKAGNSAEAENARGVYHLLLHNYAEAREHLERAKSAGIPSAVKNLEVLDEMESF
ncbi:MAG: DUF3868 domain-containing protein [Roseburia sp.]|nr:DUF3868 domain-containing protein [Roseburia sp.]